MTLEECFTSITHSGPACRRSCFDSPSCKWWMPVRNVYILKFLFFGEIAKRLFFRVYLRSVNISICIFTSLVGGHKVEAPFFNRTCCLSGCGAKRHGAKERAREATFTIWFRCQKPLRKSLMVPCGPPPPPCPFHATILFFNVSAARVPHGAL